MTARDFVNLRVNPVVLAFLLSALVPTVAVIWRGGAMTQRLEEVVQNQHELRVEVKSVADTVAMIRLRQRVNEARISVLEHHPIQMP